MIDLIAQKLGDLAKPSGKGKKKPSPLVSELLSELRTAQGILRGRLPEVSKMLDGLVKVDAEMDWAALTTGIMEVLHPTRVSRSC